ncbi:hypothetical protein G3480_15765 [Thiorhodococcus mannitoliphagus]|uniref:Ketosynthase n=1 Tax=Thiorhodococcus mannitoliphagus TaxID=329406 RepID=A0A6P1DXN6_9GAMM|nr:hypothetical protein [Thiorhodococcus mannitoliphagus]NEX21751.1 hypothetical protein [Thiorhodococcus mannitoliphagus]
MRPSLRLLRWISIAVLSGTYVLLAYVSTARGGMDTLAAIVAIAPIAVFALILAWRARYRVRSMALWSCAMAGLATAWPLIEAEFAWVYFIQHAGVFALLTLVFGRTLLPKEEPMVTRLARLVHGHPLAPEILRYTRWVTLMWTLFFAGMTVASGLLFALGDLAHWSFFATLLTPALVAITFGAEYLVRLWVLPAEIRTGLLESIRAGVAATRGTAPPAL